MFAILKGGRGLPVALFEITRETPKRYYGRIIDQLGKSGRYVFVRGYTTHRDGIAHVDKYIVACLLPTDRGWYENKDALTSTLATLIRNNGTLDAERNLFDQEIRDAQAACLIAAKSNVTAILEAYTRG